MQGWITEYNLICFGRTDIGIFRHSAGTAATFPRSRLFEYTSNDLQERYQSKLTGLAELPALVVAETYPGKQPPKPAFLSMINNIRASGNQIMFGFNHLYEISSEEVFESDYFDIEEFENSRTHWAVKEGNLIEGFFKLLQDSHDGDRPRFFGVERWPLRNLGHIAVMMPFQHEFDSIYNAIKTACRNQRLEARRVDEIYKPTKIMDDVFSTIIQSQLVICDLTNRNPNVLYETGIAHALNCEVIMITQDMDDIPFDLRQFRAIKYLSNQEGLLKLTADLQQTIQETLTDY